MTIQFSVETYITLIDTIGSTGFLKKSSKILSLQIIKIPKKSTLQYLKVDSYKSAI